MSEFECESIGITERDFDRTLPGLSRFERDPLRGLSRLEADVAVGTVLFHVSDRLGLLGSRVPQLSRDRMQKRRWARLSGVPGRPGPSRRETLTTTSTRFFFLSSIDPGCPSYETLRRSGARKYTRSTSPSGPSTVTTFLRSVSSLPPCTLSAYRRFSSGDTLTRGGRTDEGRRKYECRSAWNGRGAIADEGELTLSERSRLDGVK